MKNVFLSFNLGNDKWFVGRVNMYLKRQPDLNVFYYDQQIHYDRYPPEIEKASREALHFVFFHGQVTGDYQAAEAHDWYELHGRSSDHHRMIIELPGAGEWHFNTKTFRQGVHQIRISFLDGEHNLTERNACDCAAQIAQSINGKWFPYDGLPEKYMFNYEKDIIEQFALPGNQPEERYLKEGCPEVWPEVNYNNGKLNRNPLDPDKIGSFRSPSDTVLVDVRSKYHKPGNNSCNTTGNICCLADKGLTFLEAGPREMLQHGHEIRLNVGILVTGGIAPGINAVIAGIVERHSLYWKEHVRNNQTLFIHCYLDGFSGLLEGRKRLIDFVREGDDEPQNSSRLATILDNANAGGAVLGTSRYDELSNLKVLDKRNDALNEVLGKLWNDRIDILYIIGGDGSMKAAHALHTINKAWLRGDPNKIKGPRDISIVGIPKTMDNDILWVWQSFGFMSAVEKASECLRLLHTEATSNPRLGIIQLFGSDSGFTVSHAALASLQCDAALIPEIRFNMDWLFDHIKKRLEPRLQKTEKQRSPFGTIVMAETAVPEDWMRYVSWKEHLARIGQNHTEFLSRIKDKKLRDAIRKELKKKGSEDKIDLSRQEVEAIIMFFETKRRVYGQTPDALRTVSLRLVSQVLQYRIQNEMGLDDPYWKTFRVFTSEPRHLLRSSPPSANDIISGRRFGTLAVDNAMAGYSDFMISQWLTEYVLVPLSLVVLGRKRVPRNGIFWKSVLAKTGQQDITIEEENPS